MVEGTALAQQLSAAAKGVQLGRGGVHGLVGWLEPFSVALGYPDAPTVPQTKLGRKAATVRERAQQQLLQQEQEKLPQQRQQLRELLKGYSTASPACIELLQLLDACTGRLLQAAAEFAKAGQRGLPEGISPAAARVQQKQHQQKQQLQQETCEVDEATRGAQAASLLACGILGETSLDSVPAAATTRHRLAAAITSPSRLSSLSTVLQPFPAAATRDGGKQSALLHLCVCRLLAAAATCSPAAAWRIASAAQGATATAAAAAAAAAGSIHGVLHSLGERDAQQHPLNQALTALCEGPSLRLLQGRSISSKRSGASVESSLLPPAPKSQSCWCQCPHCTDSEAAEAAATHAGDPGSRPEDRQLVSSKRGWHNAWGAFFVRCCCLSCRGETDLRGSARTPEAKASGPAATAAAAAAAAAADFGTRRHLEAAAAAAASAASDVRSTLEAFRSRSAREGLGGCGLVPIRYALRQEALRLLLVLLLHQDSLVSDALLQPRRRQLQQQQQKAVPQSGVGDLASTSKQGDGSSLLRYAIRGLCTDRELDALCFLVGLFEVFMARPGRSREAEAAARRLFLVSGPGGFPLPVLLQRFTAREDLKHLLVPLLSRCRASCPVETDSAAESLSRRRSPQNGLLSGADNSSGLPTSFFSSSWVLQRLLAYLLLLAAGRGGSKAPSISGFPEEAKAFTREPGVAGSIDSALLSLALGIRPLHLPPQQELLLQLFKAHPALTSHFLNKLSGLLLSPRQSATFALSCLFLCRILETPWSQLPYYRQRQHQVEQQHPICGSGPDLTLPDGDMGFASVSETMRTLGVAEDEEKEDLFGDLEPLRLRHSQQQHKQQDALQRRWRAVALEVARVASPALLLRQHLSQCLLQTDTRVAFCGIAVLRACCQALRCMHDRFKYSPTLQHLLLAQAALRLPDAKTLVNSLLRLVQQWQQQQQGEQQRHESEKVGDPGSNAVEVTEDRWLSDEALARAAAASAAAAARKWQKEESERLRHGDSEESDGDDVEVHVEGVGEAEGDGSDTDGEDAGGETNQDNLKASAAEMGVSVKDLMQLLVRLTALDDKLNGYQLVSDDRHMDAEECDMDFVSFQFLRGWMETAEIYQELLTPSFPLDWGKLLCTWRTGDGAAQSFHLCCKSRLIATDIARLAVQSRGGMDSWGGEIAAGCSVSKQQQLLLLHLLLQWQRSVKRSRSRELVGPYGGDVSTEGRLEPLSSDALLQTILQFMHKSGMFRGATSGTSEIDEASLWLAALAESSCFRCSALYFVAILRLASEQRLALLPYTEMRIGRDMKGAEQEGEEIEELSSPSLFSAALLAHLSVAPRCNAGKALFVELAPLGVAAPADSCWGCNAMHSSEFCAEAATSWAVQGFMRCCILCPSIIYPLLRVLQAEGPWRVLGSSLNVSREPNSPTGVEAAKAAAAQHPQSKLINRYRKRLLRFLKVSCQPHAQEVSEEGDDASGSQTLDYQLSQLPLVSSPLAADWGLPSPVHAIAPEALLRICAVRIPGASPIPRGPVGSAERANCLGLLRALTRHLDQSLEMEACVATQPLEKLIEVNQQTRDRLLALLLQLEAVSRHLSNIQATEGANNCLEDGYNEMRFAVLPVGAGKAAALEQLFRLSTIALGRCEHLSEGAAESVRHSKPPVPHAERNGRKKGRFEPSFFTRDFKHWVELGAALCAHTANLFELTAAGVTLEETAGLRLLCRSVEFFAALVWAEDQLTPEAQSALTLAACMQRLRLPALSGPISAQTEKPTKHSQTEDTQEGPLQALLLGLVRRVARAARPFVSEGGRPLLLLACELVLKSKDKTSCPLSSRTAKAYSSLLHLRWLLPLVESWGLAALPAQHRGVEEAIKGLTYGEKALTLSLVLRACGEAPVQSVSLESAADCVQRLQALPLTMCLRLHCFLKCLWGHQRAEHHIAPLETAQQQATSEDATAAAPGSCILDAAVRVMLCLCFQCIPASSSLRGAEESATAGEGATIIFRQGLIRTLRACWDQYAVLRYTCTRLFLSSEEKAEDATCPVLHPAVRLALLLQWREPVQGLPARFYPSVVAALQQCQEERPEGKAGARADSRGTRKGRIRGTGPTSATADGAEWAADVLEALKLTAYARDSNGANSRRVRARGAPWQTAAAFLGDRGGNAEAKDLAADAPARWSAAVQQFLTFLCVQQPGGYTAARLGMQLAQDLESITGRLDDDFMVQEGWPVSGWVRYLAASLILQAAEGDENVAVAALHCLAANRTGLGASLKDLKTELRELQDALQEFDLSDDSAYTAGVECAAAAAADLAYYIGAMSRASHLGRVVLGALQCGLTADGSLTKDQRQFFKALRPKAQLTACSFLEVIGSSPPTAAICRGAEALLKVPSCMVPHPDSLSLTSEVMALQAWTSLLLPAIQLAMSAAALEPSREQAAAYARRMARQALLSPAFRALGHCAKEAVQRTLTATSDGACEATSISVALMPLLQCLSQQLLPAANDTGSSAHSVPEQDEEGEEEALCRLSEKCPELFEALINLYGASTSYVDIYLCRILMLDSAGSELCGRTTEQEGPEGQQGGHSNELPTEMAGDSAGSYDAFSNLHRWMAHLPDFREVSETKFREQVTPLSKGLILGSPCDWLALDPRRVKDTLENFAFHARVGRTREPPDTRMRGQSLSEGILEAQQRFLESALKARSMLTTVSEREAADGMEGDAEAANGTEHRQAAACMSHCLQGLALTVDSGAASFATAENSAYDVAYVVPYLAGRLTTACFVLLWRWQVLLEEEQSYQQQARMQREEEGSTDPSVISSRAALARQRPVCAAEQARRACGVAGAWLRSLKDSQGNCKDGAATPSRQETSQTAAVHSAETVGAAASGSATENVSSIAATNPEPLKRRREDVWDMDEFDPDVVQRAVTRVSTFLKAARRIGRFWRPLDDDSIAAERNKAADREVAQALEVWGASVDDGDQWLSSFASGGSLQLLIMALGCPDKMTREAAAHGLSMYTHLLQLSADRSLLCHFADVHEFKMQCRKRHANATSQTAKRRDMKQRHKASTFAFRAVKQLLTLLGSLMASIQSPEGLVDKQCEEGSALEARTMPVVSPVVCAFAAAAVPLLFLPDLSLYPIINYAVLKHPALSLLLHEPCMPLTLAALRQPLLGSDGIFSRLLLSTSVATSAAQKQFLLVALKRAMAVSQCLGDGCITLSSRLKAHKATQAVLPPPALLAQSTLPLMSGPTSNLSLVRSILDALLLATAAPSCLSACTWWHAHAAFILVSAQTRKDDLHEFEGSGYSHVMANVHLPLATVNAQHLLQRFGIILWLDAQIETALSSLVGNREYSGANRSAISDCACGGSHQVSILPIREHLLSESQRVKGCCRGSKTQALPVINASKWVQHMKDCTRLLWSLITAATLAAPLPDFTAAERRLWDNAHRSSGLRSTDGTCIHSHSCVCSNLPARCFGYDTSATASQASSENFPGAADSEHNGAFWPLGTGYADAQLLQAVMGARRQLFKLRRSAKTEVGEDHGKCDAAVNGASVSNSADGLFLHSAWQLQLELLQGIQRLARAWLAFAMPIGARAEASDGPIEGRLGFADSAAWASDLLDASVTCLSGLWAVAACSESLGLISEPSTVAEPANLSQKQLKLQASACCADVLRLCARAAALQEDSLMKHWQLPKHSGMFGLCSSRPLWNMVFTHICNRGLGPEGSILHSQGDAAAKSRCVLLALLQIRSICGSDAHLQQLIAVAAGL